MCFAPSPHLPQASPAKISQWVGPSGLFLANALSGHQQPASPCLFTPTLTYTCAPALGIPHATNSVFCAGCFVDSSPRPSFLTLGPILLFHRGFYSLATPGRRWPPPCAPPHSFSLLLKSGVLVCLPHFSAQPGTQDQVKARVVLSRQMKCVSG